MRVMVLDYRKNIVSAQYLENELMELDQTLHICFDMTRSRFGLLPSILANIQHSYGPWLLSKFLFLLFFVNELMEFDQILYMH